MQPTIIFTASAPGMIYLNGRFAGEASRERPLYAPVSPCGPVYMEYRPLTGAGPGLARRCVFSGGAPLADSLADADGLCCVAWPGGVLEAEFTAVPTLAEPVFIDNMAGEIWRGERTELMLNGLRVPLPDGARAPRLMRQDGAALLVGGVDGGGQYLAALAPDLSALLGTLEADAIEPADGGLISAVVSLKDRVGHAQLEQWIVDGDGLRRVSSESAWSAGAPRWPDTAEDTMIAAVEAALAGLPAEAEGYLSPALATGKALASIGQICEGCAPMKYGMPGERACVGLLRAENAHLAVARPLYYRAEPSGGQQGPWQIVALSLE